MPSPFPGMNPFLEQPDAWDDFHPEFISKCREELNPLVGPNYIVKVEVRIYYRELSSDERRFFARPDVGISATQAPQAARAAVLEQGEAPVELNLPNVDVIKHRSIEIRDRVSRRLVTAIELLSPSNKTPGPDRDDYLAKRARLFEHDTSLVEIDLRRGAGVRPGPPELPACDYYVLVAPGPDLPRMGFWPISLRDRLPVIPVPLASPDPPVKLDLQTIVHRAYDAAGFAKYIYQQTPEPPLSPEDAAWAKSLLAGR